jgi:hypothetical protein
VENGALVDTINQLKRQNGKDILASTTAVS